MLSITAVDPLWPLRGWNPGKEGAIAVYTDCEMDDHAAFQGLVGMFPSTPVWVHLPEDIATITDAKTRVFESMCAAAGVPGLQISTEEDSAVGQFENVITASGGLAVVVCMAPTPGSIPQRAVRAFARRPRNRHTRILVLFYSGCNNVVKSGPDGVVDWSSVVEDCPGVVLVDIIIHRMMTPPMPKEITSTLALFRIGNAALAERGDRAHREVDLGDTKFGQMQAVYRAVFARAIYNPALQFRRAANGEARDLDRLDPVYASGYGFVRSRLWEKVDPDRPAVDCGALRKHCDAEGGGDIQVVYGLIRARIDGVLAEIHNVAAAYTDAFETVRTDEAQHRFSEAVRHAEEAWACSEPRGWMNVRASAKKMASFGDGGNALNSSNSSDFMVPVAIREAVTGTHRFYYDRYRRLSVAMHPDGVITGSAGAHADDEGRVFVLQGDWCTSAAQREELLKDIAEYFARTVLRLE